MEEKIANELCLVSQIKGHFQLLSYLEKLKIKQPYDLNEVKCALQSLLESRSIPTHFPCISIILD